jgi:hypothetical protein
LSRRGDFFERRDVPAVHAWGQVVFLAGIATEINAGAKDTTPKN